MVVLFLLYLEFQDVSIIQYLFSFIDFEICVQGCTLGGEGTQMGGGQGTQMGWGGGYTNGVGVGEGGGGNLVPRLLGWRVRPPLFHNLLKSCMPLFVCTWYFNTKEIVNMLKNIPAPIINQNFNYVFFLCIFLLILYFVFVKISILLPMTNHLHKFIIISDWLEILFNNKRPCVCYRETL